MKPDFGCIVCKRLFNSNDVAWHNRHQGYICRFCYGESSELVNTSEPLYPSVTVPPPPPDNGNCPKCGFDFYEKKHNEKLKNRVWFHCYHCNHNWK
jgi:hypothetical protein